MREKGPEPSEIQNRAPMGPLWPPKRKVLGIPVSDTDYQQAVESIIQAARQGQGGLVALMPVHGLTEGIRREEFGEKLERFDMVAPDGQPVRWAMNWLTGTSLRDRVYGPELMVRICERAAQLPIAVYFLGGTPEVVTRLAKNLSERFAGLQVVGQEAPPFRPLTAEEDRAVVERINGSGARILFLGLGCPKQEEFAFAHRTSIKAVQIGVGAAFDFHSGEKSMAPYWMQRWGLEWAFRFLTEPRRLWRRYLVSNVYFLVVLSLALFNRSIIKRAARG